MSQHKHKWTVMYDGDSERETVEIFAVCLEKIKDEPNSSLLSMNFITTHTCGARLSREDIEHKINLLERTAE